MSEHNFWPEALLAVGVYLSWTLLGQGTMDAVIRAQVHADEEAGTISATRRSLARGAALLHRCASTARFVGLSESEDECPDDVIVAAVSAKNAAHVGSAVQNSVNNLLDEHDSTLWCGNEKGTVRIELSGDFHVSRLELEMALKDPHGQAVARTKAVRAYFSSGDPIVIEFPATGDGPSGRTVVVDNVDRVTRWVEIAGAELAPHWTRTFCLSQMWIVGRGGEAAVPQTVDLALATGTSIPTAYIAATSSGIPPHRESHPSAPPPSFAGMPVPSLHREPASPPAGLERLAPAGMTASSWMDVAGDAHPPAHAFDDNPKTSWQERSPGAGEGEWIEARFAAPEHIRRVQVVTGYDTTSAKWGDLFPMNAHLKRFRVIFDGGTTLKGAAGEGERSVTFNTDVTATTVRIVADEVWSGNKWPNDLCISEIGVFGESPAGVAGAARNELDTVLVPAATFTMGSDSAADEAHARPSAAVTISRSFTIDKYEVTTEAYASCVAAGACTPSGIRDPSIKQADLPRWQSMCNAGAPGREKNPINCVSRDQAASFCTWRQMRLPTEAEWELAARGTDAREYPWGNAGATCASAKTRGCDDAARTIDVGTLSGGAAPSGAYDMAGNVWEWVDDGWDAQPPSTLGTTDPHRPFTGPKGVLRGGSWDFAGSWAKAYFRLGFPAATAADATGIRCAKTP